MRFETGQLRRSRGSVERNAVSFGIDDHGAKTVFADLLPFPQNLSTVRPRRFDRFLQAPFDQEINQRAVRRRPVIETTAVSADAKTPGCVLFFVRQKPVLHSVLR